jgi:hypothetical protein
LTVNGQKGNSKKATAEQQSGPKRLSHASSVIHLGGVLDATPPRPLFVGPDPEKKQILIKPPAG